MLRVKCLECGEEHTNFFLVHNPNQVIILDIEENIVGEDVITYICPVTKNITKSRVYSVS